MSGDGEQGKRNQPEGSGAGRTRRDERDRRLAERLRDNLKKRKAQDRARRDQGHAAKHRGGSDENAGGEGA
ncbi:MAG: hypothetical protein R3316_04070 [Rhodovibrionaceae bacterium]|nr:hypothetical protein [Rhodovibrionaceae bacterium]